ncbi:MAG: acetate kinase [Spirochaetales bacterium]|jgi:acetate kinase|nr:acetate kinase [Spirochaetales bacterium]
MKSILIINCGSSSLKYEVYEMPDRRSLGKGLIERIGGSDGHLTQKTPEGKTEYDENLPDHKAAMGLMLKALTAPGGILKSVEDIAAVGHRVVHGGEDYSASVIIDGKVIKAIEDNTELAPLHNPANLTGIREAQTLLPHCPQAAVWDTAFHQTLSPAAYLYGLDRRLYEEYRIRRYGFHGTSHRYVCGEAARILNLPPQEANFISCHLGNGASITAVAAGKSVDTSMGFTPLEGLVMGTRSGDLDPAILLYLLDKGLSKTEINNELNKKGGMLGLSGVSNDMRDIGRAAAEGNRRAEEALEVYAHRIRKYIGGYTANLDRVDAVIFTGGIGENDIPMRERIAGRLKSIGIVLDPARNKEVRSGPGIISAQGSPITLLVVPTNEELQIALDTYEIVFG